MKAIRNAINWLEKYIPKSVSKEFLAILREGLLPEGPLHAANPYQSEDSILQALFDFWFLHEIDASLSQKNRVLRAYLLHVLGLNFDEIQTFFKGSVELEEVCIVKIIGVVPAKNDLTSFWIAVSDIFPFESELFPEEVYSDQLITRLLEYPSLPRVFLWQFNHCFATISIRTFELLKLAKQRERRLVSQSLVPADLSAEHFV